MSTLPRRQYGLFLTAGLAAIAAVVAGVVLFTSSKASGVELTTAKLVPSDAGLYYAINTDLDSSQWIATFDLAKRMGEEDPEEQIKDGADDVDIAWDDEVAPFLGGNAAVYLHSVDVIEGDMRGAVILKADDAEKAMDVILDRAGEDWEDGTEDGREYHFDEFSGIWLARIDDHIVLAASEESLFEVFAVADGDVASLDQNDEYRQLRDDLSSNFLYFVYVNADAFAEDALDSVARDALEEAGVDELALKPMAFVAGAKKDSFEFQAASVAGPGTVSAMLEAKDSRFADLVPADTSVFAVTRNIAQAWEESVEQARSTIDDAISEDSEYDSLDDALRDAGSEVGLESIQELIDQLTGEAAVAFWFPTGDTEEAEGVFLAEVASEADARDIIGRMSTSDGSRIKGTEQVDGVEMTLFEDEDGEEAAWAIRDGYIVIGSVEGVRRILEGGESLADSERYQRTVSQVPSRLGTFLFVDLHEVLRLEEAGVPEELDDATSALEGLIVNLVADRDIARINAALTIAE
ncbi:MAG: DUF3352 domain-containing protein [Dehalococcoidia bacterium]|nr:DUF3352 domain-containing protein [Dehalococcoidia bacterium]